MLHIRPMRVQDIDALRSFTDEAIGTGYYSLEEVTDILRRSTSGESVLTLILEDDRGKIRGVRITYPPGQWSHGKGNGLTPQRWPHRLEETAYFQSLFLADEVQGQGWGGKLSQRAIELLKEKTPARGIVTHSWKESPNNSSTKYLLKLGFQPINEYPGYWKDVDYNCTRCLKPPCLCTATEMYLDFKPKD